MIAMAYQHAIILIFANFSRQIYQLHRMEKISPLFKLLTIKDFLSARALPVIVNSNELVFFPMI